jgi:radical SAM-linked protein
MSEAPPSRYRIRFAKAEPMRFTSHLDLFRTLERTLRRAALDMVYSKGFNPRPRMSLASPLPLGCTSEGELGEFWLRCKQEPQDLLARLRHAAPPGLRFDELWAAAPNLPKLQAQVRSAVYEAWLREGQDPPPNLGARLDALLQASEIPSLRRGKRKDLRPLVESLELLHTTPPTLRMQLASRPDAAGRPDEVLAALDMNIADFAICRTSLLLAPHAASA